MTTTVTITGTGSPRPSARRAGPGVLIRHGDRAIQVDAGRATIQRLVEAGVAATDLTALLVTHHHSDHLTGLTDLLLTRWIIDRDDRVPPLEVVLPSGPAQRLVGELLVPWREDLRIRRRHTGRVTEPAPTLVAFDPPAEPSIVWEDGPIRVAAVEVRHEPVRPAVGYRIETPDGVVAVTGDTLVCPEVADLARGADVLVYEAMRFEAVRRWPASAHFVMDYHADTPAIGAQATELGVPVLILTHLIPAPETPAEVAAFVADIRGAGYPGRLIVADDLATVTLPGRSPGFGQISQGGEVG